MWRHQLLPLSPVMYQFIAITDRDNVKPKDHNTRNLIAKHVMRDIGKARREAKRNTQFELQMQEEEERFSFGERASESTTWVRAPGAGLD